MSYITKNTMEGLISIAKECGLKVDEKTLRDLIDYDGDPHEADDEIGISITDSNESAHYHHSVGTMADYEQSFMDLFVEALKMLGISDYDEESEYVSSSQSEDIVIRIGDSEYKYNFRYGYASDAELLAAFSSIATDHSDVRIAEIHGPDESYILFVPVRLADYLHEHFTFMRKI